MGPCLCMWHEEKCDELSTICVGGGGWNDVWYCDKHTAAYIAKLHKRIDELMKEKSEDV